VKHLKILAAFVLAFGSLVFALENFFSYKGLWYLFSLGLIVASIAVELSSYRLMRTIKCPNCKEPAMRPRYSVNGNLTFYCSKCGSLHGTDCCMFYLPSKC